MIRIPSILYKISFCLIFALMAMPLKAQLVMGAKGLGMGQATTALPNYNWSLFSNPALTNNDQIALGFYGLRNYGFAEITDMSAIGSVPTKIGVASAGFHRYGDHLFNETRVRLGYKNEWRLMHFGIVANYNHISFGADYGSGGAFGVDVGIAAEITNELWIGAASTNVNQARYNGINEDLPRDISIGLSYYFNDMAQFAIDMVKDIRFPVSYRGGMEIKVIENLSGRIGITTEPLTYSLGFGYMQSRWDINFAIQKHQLLGISPGLDFMLFF